LTHSAVIANTLTEATLTNNTSQEEVSVTGSFDPNDKTARTSSGWSDTLYYIDVDTWVDYTIRFQNTGTDTAFTVVVTDTIPLRSDRDTSKIKVLSVAELFADVIEKVYNYKSISEKFII
ncbi:MAG TPA: hypothetical protein PLY31_08320, partial [Tenuifilaceae bacterium]|nr:hypothetical protein [Tenuifilaceae bacterium]